MASLKAKLCAAAKLNAGLQALLGPLPAFRWQDVQLIPTGQTIKPTVAVQQISNPKSYSVNAVLTTSFVRMQFNCFGSGADSESANSLANALFSFMETFDALGLPASPSRPNYVVGDRDILFTETQPAVFMRVIDYQIFVDDSVS